MQVIRDNNSKNCHALKTLTIKSWKPMKIIKVHFEIIMLDFMGIKPKDTL